MEQHRKQGKNRQDRPVHPAYNYQRKQQRQNGDTAACQKMDAHKNCNSNSGLKNELRDGDKHTCAQFHVNGLLL